MLHPLSATRASRRLRRRQHRCGSCRGSGKRLPPQHCFPACLLPWPGRRQRAICQGEPPVAGTKEDPQMQIELKCEWGSGQGRWWTEYRTPRLHSLAQRGQGKLQLMHPTAHLRACRPLPCCRMHVVLPYHRVLACQHRSHQHGADIAKRWSACVPSLRSSCGQLWSGLQYVCVRVCGKKGRGDGEGRRKRPRWGAWLQICAVAHLVPPVPLFLHEQVGHLLLILVTPRIWSNLG